MIITFTSAEELERLAVEQPSGTHAEYKPVDPSGASPTWMPPGLHGLTTRKTEPHSAERINFAKKWVQTVCAR